MTAILTACDLAVQNMMHMLKMEIETDLQSFLLQTNADLNMAVDFVCDRFDLDCTDELIDIVADVVEAHYGC